MKVIYLDKLTGTPTPAPTETPTIANNLRRQVQEMKNQILLDAMRELEQNTARHEEEMKNARKATDDLLDLDIALGDDVTVRKRF